MENIIWKLSILALCPMTMLYVWENKTPLQLQYTAHAYIYYV